MLLGLVIISGAPQVSVVVSKPIAVNISHSSQARIQTALGRPGTGTYGSVFQSDWTAVEWGAGSGC